MLFDLKGRRRYVVQATYLMLALLMGGGLVLFGIGSDAGQGGLIDAFTDGDSGQDSGSSVAEDRVEQAEQRLRANPRDPAALTAVIRGRYQLATAKTPPQSTTFPPEARGDLQGASDAWQRYLDLDLPRQDDSLAGLMLQVYGPSGLSRFDEAARAAEMLGLELAVACHYLAPHEDVDRFVELVPHYDSTGKRRVVAPRVGDTLVVEPGKHWIEDESA